MKKFGIATLELNRMDEENNIKGVPHINGVPCIWDRYYRYSSAEFLGLSEWLCPYCFSNLSLESEELVCLKGCHRFKKAPDISENSFRL